MTLRSEDNKLAPLIRYTGLMTMVDGTQQSIHFYRAEEVEALLTAVNKALEYGANIDSPLFNRGNQVETYENRCKYFSDRCQRLLDRLRKGRG